MMMMLIGGAPTPTGTVIALHPISFSPFTSYLASSGSRSFIRRKQNGVVLCSLLSTQNDSTHGVGSSSSSISRRKAMLQMAFSAVILQTCSSPSPALSADVPADFRLYSDDVNKYQIFIPQDWHVGDGKTDRFKSITAFYPDEAASTSNVSVVITGIGPDFTRLESFGKVNAFAENLSEAKELEDSLVDTLMKSTIIQTEKIGSKFLLPRIGGLDRSWQRPPGVTAKLIDCKSASGFYYIEYTLQNPGESRRHIYSAIGMANNGWYNRLYTITGQFMEEEADKYGSKVEMAVRSFRFS